MPRSSTVAVRRLAHVPLLLALLTSCKDDAREATPTPTPSEQPATPASHCPTEQVPEQRAPDVRPAHETTEFWLAQLEGVDHDAVLLDEQARTALAQQVAALPGGWRDPTSEAVGDPALIDRELNERLTFLRERVSTGKYVETQAGALERAAERIAAAVPVSEPNLQFVAHETTLWCVPTDEGLYTPPVDVDFDRNRCSSLHPGELVRALRRTGDGAWIYVDAGHSVGWVDQRTGPTLEPPLSVEAARARVQAQPRVWLINDDGPLRAGSSFPVRERSDTVVSIEIPSVDGPRVLELTAEAPVRDAALSFTRRTLFEQAFALLGTPYGWGGRAGHRDCSSYLLDLFAQFDIRLPRNSAVQAQVGTRSVDLSQLDEAGKRKAIREAAREGVVLLYMPGHILLYLGVDGGVDYGLSALSEYLTPCAGGPDTVHRLDKVAVTTLELGRGTERRAFIERISRMAVFAPAL
jgi:hypothetical protein